MREWPSTGIGSQGGGHGPKLPVLKCLDSALKVIPILGCFVWSRELDLTIVGGSFQTKISNDSVALHSLDRYFE